jgi:hypothetical protein
MPHMAYAQRGDVVADAAIGAIGGRGVHVNFLRKLARVDAGYPTEPPASALWGYLMCTLFERNNSLDCEVRDV